MNKNWVHILFMGDDGKVSWTKILVVHALMVFWTIYLGIFFFGIQLEEAALAFFTEVMILFVAPRPFQRALTGFKGGLGMNILKEKDKPLEELKTNKDNEKGKKDDKVAFINPCEGHVTSLFRTPQRPKHHGIDIANSIGTNIVAVADGLVAKSYSSSTYGECIILTHSNGYQTLYAHLVKGSRTVNVGDSVNQGDTLGLMGNTGRSRGVHLHFEVHNGNWNIKKSNAVDPLTLIKF